MTFAKRTTKDIVDQPDEGPPAPAGLYSVVLTGHEVTKTQAGQARMNLFFSPLAKPGKVKTVDAGIEFAMMLLGDSWENDDDFCENKRVKIADKRKIKPSQVTGEMIDTELQATRNRSQRQMHQVARALLGASEFPDLPRWDKDAKAFFDSSGKSYTKDQKDELWNQSTVIGCNVIADIATGELDLAGYVCVARISHDTFMNKTRAVVSTLFESVPEGEELLPSTEWTP